MLISPEHVQMTGQILEGDEVRAHLWEILCPHSDQLFQDRVDLLIFQQKAGFFKRVHQMPKEGYVALILSLRPEMLLMIEAQIHAIYAVLGPIYFAMGKQMPQITGRDIDVYLEDLPPYDFMSFFLEFGRYNREWYTYITTLLNAVDQRPCRAAVRSICKPFIDKLPEPLEG
ncbi:hypothetical protein K8R42_00770 [bacterium]|nr:hypothetical protein [bacterium]